MGRFNRGHGRAFHGEPSYRFSIMPAPAFGVDMNTTMRFEITASGRYVKVNEMGRPLGEVKQVGPIATGGPVPEG